jgi:tetratricopeptide (TPR) repeat protein
MLAALGPARGPDSLVAAGRRLGSSQPRAALEYFRRALAADSLNPEANWRAAFALLDIGQEIPDSVRSAARDSNYAEAERLARRAVQADSLLADAHFTLAAATGRLALTKSRRDRVKYAVTVSQEANRALALDPNHDGAHHVLGIWNAEVMRLSGFTRFLAKNLMGGKVFGQASWALALSHLEEAVRLDPTRIFHRLDLARIDAERGRYAAAREQLTAVAALPSRTALDARYRDEAARLLASLAGRVDRPDA